MTCLLLFSGASGLCTGILLQADQYTPAAAAAWASAAAAGVSGLPGDQA